MKYYLVGIKGTGMTSLARYLKDLGNYVVGSDTEEVFFTDKILKDNKIEYFIFNKNNITPDYIYVISSAYNETNEEVNKILLNDFPYYYYDKFISNIKTNNLICVAGTHGKTSTSFLLAKMFNNNASYIIGDGSGYGTSKTDYLVLEACEYKNHFLSYNPNIALITNIDFDHPDYYKDIDMVICSFQRFIDKADVVIINKDDSNSNKLKHHNLITYGFNNESDYVIKIINESADGYDIEIINNIKQTKYQEHLELVGIHNIYNFVGAYVTMLTFNLIPKTNNLSLPSRRMTEYKKNNIIIIDDYAHHPKEISCLYKSVKQKYPGYKYFVIFQPHTYSRTLTLLDDYIKCLDLFDQVYIEKVFTSKREKVNSTLERSVENGFCKYQKFNSEMLKNIDDNQKEVWIFLGAGVVNKYIFNILDKYKV